VIISLDNIVNYNYLDGSKTIDDYLGGARFEEKLNKDFFLQFDINTKGDYEKIDTYRDLQEFFNNHLKRFLKKNYTKYFNHRHLYRYRKSEIIDEFIKIYQFFVFSQKHKTISEFIEDFENVRKELNLRVFFLKSLFEQIFKSILENDEFKNFIKDFFV